MVNKHRGGFTGGLGYVMATAGAAVGLGNIWRFPYLAAKYGGGTFLFVYFFLVLTVGFTLMICETAIGRKTGQSPINAFTQLNKKYKFIGVMSTIVPMIILPYYCVVGGWVIKYLIAFLFEGSAVASLDNYFPQFIAGTSEPIVWMLVFTLLGFFVVVFGIDKGVEKVSRLVMPLLVLLTIAIAVYSITRPGAIEGLKYYLLPDVSKLSLNMLMAAMGQMFFSLSIAMGIVITYGSYMGKDVDIIKVTHQVQIFDTGIAFLSGLMIVPAVFAFAGGASQIKAGPSLMFITLPKVFDSMGAGTVIGICFFLLVLVAALTSAIALMETVVSSFRDKLGWSRKKACSIVGAYTVLLALPSSLGFGAWSSIQILGFSIFDFFDFISNSVLMPLTALCICLFVSQIIGVQSIIDEVELSGKFKQKKLFSVCVTYIAAPMLLLILVSSVLNAFNIITL